MEERDELKQELGMLNVSLTFLLLILGFFLCLALETRAKAQAEGKPAAKRSAQTNVLASLLVLLAAILRLKDLQMTQEQTQTPLLEETTLPD